MLALTGTALTALAVAVLAGVPGLGPRRAAVEDALVLADDEIEELIESPDAAKRLRGCDALLSGGRMDNFQRVWCLRDRGVARLELGRPREAISDFDRATNIDPEACPGVLVARGLAYLVLGDFAEAAEDFDAACAPGLELPEHASRPHDYASAPPRVWARIARLRSGVGDAGILKSYVEVRKFENAEAARRSSRSVSRRSCSARVTRRYVRIYDRPGRGLDLAELFLGERSVEAYYRVWEPLVRAVPRPIDKGDPEEVAEYKEKVGRVEALRALYIGEYYLAEGDRENAMKWLARAADFEGRPDPDWPLVGRGSVARYELKRLRSRESERQQTAQAGP